MRSVFRAVCLVGAAMTMGGAAVEAQPTVAVSGLWQTQFAGAAATVSLTQSGPNVIGTYVNTPPLMPGAMAGVLRGNVLTGRWTDASSSGGFTLVFSPNGRSFAGTWGRSITSVSDGGPWVGTRQ
ncbi:MAG: hypothetical protein JNK72_09920 [Myxococcales bacterium]|nr:hypothetical protein [Myxococcales bacterium]